MASICLYDVDLFHGPSFVPNLELMKVFNYYYRRGDVIKLGRPGENFDRYNQVIFFKQSPGTKVPKSLPLSGETKQIYGYGFFKKFTPLKEHFQNIEPNFLPYDVEEKSSTHKNYKKYKNSSFVRLENLDLSGYDSNKKHLYIVDYNCLRLPNIRDFIEQYKNKHTIHFAYAVKPNNEEEAKWLLNSVILPDRRIFIEFKPSKNFILQNNITELLFAATPIENETYKQFLIRIVKMILLAKSKNKKLIFSQKNFTQLEIKKEPLLKLFPFIIKWGMSKEVVSGYDFIGREQQDLLANLLLNETELRLLLKQKPQYINSELFDF